jgi:hypothetical protein
MNDPAPVTSPETDPAAALEAEIDEAITLCEGDVRAALRATLLANAFLEAEVQRLSDAVSAGFARGKIRRPAKPQDSRKKAG